MSGMQGENGMYGDVPPIAMGNSYAPLNSMYTAKKFTVLSGTTSPLNHVFSTGAKTVEFYVIPSDATAIVALRFHGPGVQGQPNAAVADGSCDCMLASGQKEQLGKGKCTGFSYIVSSGTATIYVLER